MNLYKLLNWLFFPLFLTPDRRSSSSPRHATQGMDIATLKSKVTQVPLKIRLSCPWFDGFQVVFELKSPQPQKLEF